MYKIVSLTRNDGEVFAICSGGIEVIEKTECQGVLGYTIKYCGGENECTSYTKKEKFIAANCVSEVGSKES